MEDGPAQDYLQVPITEQERVQQRQRSGSVERLVPETESVYSHPFEDDRPTPISPAPTRFPSIRGESSEQPRRLHSYQGGQYAAISPIDEEDIADHASDVPSRPRTIPQSEKSFEPLVPLPDLWTPVWLKRSTLAAFILFFVAATVVLIVLWVLSATRNGFEIHFEGPHHEYWVYFPTILVIFLVGLWRQVDYYTKCLTPWDELQKGPIPPTKSLLLDYVSPLQIVALFQAFVQNHIPIVATVSSFMFFKIITVFSTGLFILLPKNVSQNNFPLLSTMRFDAVTANNLNDITSAPVSAFYGTKYQGIPEAAGVRGDLAYIPFHYDQRRSEKLAENATFSADVDAFVPIINCHAVEADLDGDSTVRQSTTGDVYGDGVRFSLPADDICNNWPAIVVQALNPETQIGPTSQIYGSARSLSCGSDNQPVALLFSVLDLSFEQELRPGSTELALADEPVATSSSRTVNSMANVVCQASHTITRVTVANNTLDHNSQTNDVKLDLVSNAQNRTLAGLSDEAFVSALEAIISTSGPMFGATVGADDTSGFFSLLSMHFGNRDVGRLLQTNDLVSATETTLRGVMAQYARQSLSQPASAEITGLAVRRETRYVVNEASAAVMIAALVVGAVAGVILLLSAPRGVVPRNPGPIAANAATLTNSIELNRLLRRGGLPSENNSEVALDGYEFGTAIATTEHGQSSFKIVTSEGVRDHNAPQPDKALHWWHPISSNIFFVVATVALPILIIGLLEFTQSKNAEGIVGVPDNLATDIYTHYIPSLVMVIIASMVNLIDFNVLVFTPWSALAKGAATHKTSILAHYLGMTPLEAAFKAFKVRQFNVVMSTLATVVASILTIVAAGLYNGDKFDTPGTSISLIQSDEFSLRWENSAMSDNGAGGTISSILHENLSYPSFTYRNLVLPAFSLENGDLSTFNGTTRDTARNSTEIETDALLPDLQCYLVDRDFITVTPTGSGTDVSVLATLPENCQIAGVDGTATFISFTASFHSSSASTLIGGRQSDLLFGTGASLLSNVLDTAQQNLSSLISDNPPVGCPSLAFTYGSISLSNDSDSSFSSSTDTITSMLCYQHIKTVRGRFDLISNTTTIDPRRGVTIDQSDASLLRNPISNASSVDDADKVFDFRIQGNLARGLRPFADTQTEGLDLDAFFQGVLHAQEDAIDPASLVGEENQTALLTAILAFYRLYMAQAISLNMRVPLDSSSSSLASNATNNLAEAKSRDVASSAASSTLLSSLISRQNRPILATIPTTLTTTRLVQDSTTKLILQLLLGLTSVLTFLGWSLTRFRRVLPLNPLSIANSMALLAGSDLAHTEEAEEERVCECCGKRRRASFEGAHFDAEGRPISSWSPNASSGGLLQQQQQQRGRTEHRHQYQTQQQQQQQQQQQAKLSVPDGVEFDARSSSPRGTREGVVPVGAEWWGVERRRWPPLDRRSRETRNEKARWEVVFAGRRYSMGWWKENKARGRMRRRFGVDVGDRPDGHGGEDEEWTLGRRRLRNSREGSVGMRFEGGWSSSSARDSVGPQPPPPPPPATHRGADDEAVMGVETAYEGHGYGPGPGPGPASVSVSLSAMQKHMHMQTHQPRPSSDLGYGRLSPQNPFADPENLNSSAYRRGPQQYRDSALSAATTPSGVSFAASSAAATAATAAAAAAAPWSLGARRVRDSQQDVTPSMRFEQHSNHQQRQQRQQHAQAPIEMITRGRALDVPPTPGLYGEGGLRGESVGSSAGRGIASSDRGDDDDDDDDYHYDDYDDGEEDDLSGDEHEDYYERGNQSVDLGGRHRNRYSSGGNGNDNGAMNFSRGGYHRVVDGGGGGEA